MNPVKPPKNLPSGENSQDYITFKIPEIKIAKNKFKTLLKYTIVVVIILIASPRIFKNISSTLAVVEKQSKKFPTIFPDLALTGETINSFFSRNIHKLYNLTEENIASVGEIFFSRKDLNQGEIKVLSTTSQSALKTEVPIRIIINKIKVNSLINNPTSTNLETLDKALLNGAVRYPKSGLLGEYNNIYLFGHSTSYKIVRNKAYKTFNNINKLHKGDTIELLSRDKKYIYAVAMVKMEKNSDAIVRFNTGKKTLTLSTCNTLGNKEDRYIVTANFIKSLPLTKIISKNKTKENKKYSSQKPNTISKEKTSTKFKIIPINTTNSVSLVTHSNPYGKADLTAKIIAIGILDKKTNKFIATTTLKSNEKIAFKFIISNKGDKKVSNWKFSAVLPTDPLYMFFSKSQKTLFPNKAIEFTLGFDKPKLGKNIIIVNVDNTREIFESNEKNNIVKKFITVTK